MRSGADECSKRLLRGALIQCFLRNLGRRWELLVVKRADRFKGDPLRDARHAMIRHTEAYLAWGLRRPDVPRIPCRRVEDGGFSFLRYEPQARALVADWWNLTLEGD